MKHRTLKNWIIALILFFLYLPIIILVIYSFNTSKMNVVFEGFTLDWYKTLFDNTDLIEAFMNTMIIAITSTAISTVIGTLGAVGLKKYKFKGKQFINLLLYIPIVIPEIVLGISLLSVYTLTKLELGMFTLILSHIAFSIPFVIVSVRSALSKDLDTYEEAAKDLGANNTNTFFKIVCILYFKSEWFCPLSCIFFCKWWSTCKKLYTICFCFNYFFDCTITKTYITH